MPEVRSILSESELDYLLEPANYIGLAVEMTNKIVDFVRKGT
jgi:adenylosuccinate lyase